MFNGGKWVTKFEQIQGRIDWLIDWFIDTLIPGKLIPGLAQYHLE